MKRRHLSLAVLAVLVVLAMPAGASAAPKYNVAVGIGDQSPQMFSNPAYQALKIKKARYFIPWDAATDPAERAKADAYVAAARQARVKVLLHIHTRGIFTPAAKKLPSVKEYRKAVGKLVRRYKKQGVKDWGAWNEVNHKTQPTYRNPKRSAQYFLELRKLCKGCTIVALDVLDQKGVERYITRFYKALGSRARLARIVGIHNYSDTNRFRSKGTRSIIRTAKKHNRRAKFWLTETGGVAAFSTAFPFDVARQAKATRYMFKLTRDHRRDVQRLYSYNFFGAPAGARFDAGLVDPDGSPRPAYEAFRKQLKRFKR